MPIDRIRSIGYGCRMTHSPPTKRLFGLFAIAGLLLGCSNEQSTDDTRQDTPKVVATTGMIADVAREIAGEHAEVEQLMGAGVDPHLYAPSRTDIQKLMEADLVLYTGLLLEGRMTDTLVRAAGGDRQVIAVTDKIDASELLMPEDFEGHPDPHIWMDVSMWRRAADRITEALAGIQPERADDIRSANSAYQEQLDALDAYADRCIGSIPENQRVLVTAHDAFNYLGRRYGLEVVGIQGISTESEAGVGDIERLVDLLVSRQIPAVFVESTVAERNIKALVEGAKARGHTVTIGGTLYSDAMGKAGTYEGTYIGMIDHNVTTIARALGGQAPEGGMQGKLGTQ